MGGGEQNKQDHQRYISERIAKEFFNMNRTILHNGFISGKYKIRNAHDIFQGRLKKNPVKIFGGSLPAVPGKREIFYLRNVTKPAMWK